MTTRSGTSANRYVDTEVVQRVLKYVDAAGLFAAGLVISVVNIEDPIPDGAPGVVGFLALELALSCVYLLRTMGLYDVKALGGGLGATARTVTVWFVAGGLLFELTNLMLLRLGHAWLPMWFAFSAGHVLLTRQAVALWATPIARRGGFRKRIAIVGGGKPAEDAIALLESSSGIDADVIGLFDDRDDGRSPAAIDRHRKIGRIEDLADFARQSRVDLIIVAIPLSAEARLLHILKRLWELPVDIRISGQSTRLRLGPRVYTYMGKLPLLPVFDRPLNGWSQFVKAGLDRVLAGLAIVLLSPLMIAAAVAVKLESKGPVIFRQKRYGFNNELIEVFKFRSMYADRSDANAARLVTKGDARVTRVGRIIRKTSIDELPQLFNVLTGQLSLVGPRPHATQAKAAEALYEKVVDGYFARHRVKPGITGWAQINGWRGETDTREKLEQRVKHDLDYIDQWSLAFDLYIIAWTPFALLKSQNAY